MGNQPAGWKIVLIILVAFCLPAAPATADAEGVTCPKALSRGIPLRAPGTLTGSEFVRQTAAMSEVDREAVIGDQLLAGDLPPFLRHLKSVTLQGQTADGRIARVTVCVTPDYLALGSNEDFLRIPMALPTALRVADRFGFVLPTPKIVDAIYEQADVHLRPQPLPAGPQMRTTAYYWRHETQIRAQRLALGAPLGALIAGDKKDLVLTNLLLERPGRVAIYGWHRGDGDPIQPLSTVHGARYADYSHGVRLVSAVAYVDGHPRAIAEVLEDRQLAPVVSDEGPIPVPAVMLMEARSKVLAQAEQPNG
jgi:hypothetical protein